MMKELSSKEFYLKSIQEKLVALKFNEEPLKEPLDELDADEKRLQKEIKSVELDDGITDEARKFMNVSNLEIHLKSVPT